MAVGSRDVAKAQAFIDQPREHETIREPVRAHGSYQALVDDPEVDVVYIGTPHPDHIDSMRLALAAGKAVLCEKPFTLNRREAEEAVALARRHDAFLMEAMWMRYVPAMVELKRLRRRAARSASRCRCRRTSASRPPACRRATARWPRRSPAAGCWTSASTR